MKKIKVSDTYCLVDDEDYETLSKHKWFLDSSGYAKVSGPKLGIKGSHLMHRQILNANSKLDVDHINGNRLDNTRKNLRLCSREQNLHNSKLHKDNKSGFKGVHIAQGKYQVSIMSNGKRYYLGAYDNSIDAAKAYDKKAIELNGVFARTNFKQER